MTVLAVPGFRFFASPKRLAGCAAGVGVGFRLWARNFMVPMASSSACLVFAFLMSRALSSSSESVPKKAPMVLFTADFASAISTCFSFSFIFARPSLRRNSLRLTLVLSKILSAIRLFTSPNFGNGPQLFQLGALIFYSSMSVTIFFKFLVMG